MKRVLCCTNRGKVFPVTRKSRKFLSYWGSSTDSCSHCTESSVVQLWTVGQKEGVTEWKIIETSNTSLEISLMQTEGHMTRPRDRHKKAPDSKTCQL